MLEEMLADSQSVDETKKDGLKKLAGLALDQEELERQIQSAELQLKQLNAELRTLSEERIPDLMTELGVSEYRTVDGLKVAIKPYYSASIKEEKKAEAFNWLRAHKLDDLIKNVVAVSFGRGEDKAAQEMAEALASNGLQVQHTESVHPMTLKAFVKERIEGGLELPMETFGVFTGRKTVIKRT